MDRKSFESALLDALKRSLAVRGFRRAGRNFRLVFDASFAIVSLQADKYTNDVVGKYICSYGGGTKKYFDACPMGFPEYKPDHGLFPWIARTGAFSGRDAWLTVRYADAADAIARSVDDYVAVVADEATQLAAIFESDASLRRWLSSDASFGMSDFARERALAVL